MPRKKWTSHPEVTPNLLKLREKRKWQIALRRYVLQKQPCVSYAPFFGLDIENFRNWISMQFTNGASWENFGTVWQFDHIIPVAYFDFTIEEELQMCWNFTNIRVGELQKNKDLESRVDVYAAEAYYSELFKSTGYFMCEKLSTKLKTIQLSQILSTENQRAFILANQQYLSHIQNYSSFEFELLNSGRHISEVLKEINIIKNL